MYEAPSSQKLFWFEFLLNPSLLEKYLSESNTDPSPTDLIIKFLVNSMSFYVPESNGNQNVNQPENASPLPSTPLFTNGSEDVVEISDYSKNGADEKKSKKKAALKLLALKVAAFLKWNLDTLEKKLPLPMQQVLLAELLKVTGSEMIYFNESNKSTSPEARFADILCNTWLLRAVIEGSYPAKSSRVINVPLPGQIDPLISSPIVIESFMRKLYEDSEKSCAALEVFLESDAPIRMPLINCFGYISEECPNPDHKWDLGLMLNNEDVICQVSYDLGRYYFFLEKYNKASKHFIRASEMYSKLKDPVFCQLNPFKLKGFYDACAHILGYHTSDASTPLKETLQTSVKKGHNKTVEILKTDNIKMELPLAFRDLVELNILQYYDKKGSDLVLYVVYANAIRRTLSGEVIIGNWSSLLKTREEVSSLILCELLKDVIPSSTPQMKSYLKNFARTLCLTSIPAKQLMKKYEKNLLGLFSSNELEMLFAYGPTAKRENYKFDKSFSDNQKVQIANLEKRLLTCTEAITIKHVVNQLRTKYTYPLWTLNKKWETPLAASIFLKSMSANVDQEIIHILLAKAAELRSIKKYSETRQLYQMINSEIRSGSPRLSRYLNWENLRLDLLECLDAPDPFSHNLSYRQDVTRRIISHLASYKKEREVPPDPDLTELCSVVFLTLRQWDKLLEIEHKVDSYIQFAKVLASVCKENTGKNTPKDLWDTILPIFSNPLSNQHKRSASGMIKDIPRDSQALLTKAQLLQFIKKLKESHVLGIIVSCLAKFYNILKDDSSGEIYLEHNRLWPSIISNSSAYNMSAVSEIFQSTLQHALSVHPTHTAWLRTKGDIMYVQGHYANALKYYVSAAMVSSDFFSLPLPKDIFDDLQFKHMIHCCTKLQNHTQASILHQFLEEPNYGMAFKALAERVCNDSCDTYYSCIWDITLLEFLVHHHTKRGEIDCRRNVIQLIGQLELNSNNNEEIQREAASLRKGWFFRALAKQYL